MAQLHQDRTVIGSIGKSSGPGLTAIVSNTPLRQEAIRFIRGNYGSKTMDNSCNNSLLLTRARNLSNLVCWRFDIKAKSLSCPNDFFTPGGHPDYLSGFKAYLALMGIEERDILQNAIRQILKTGKPYVIAYHLDSLAGQRIILQHGYCEKDSNGKIVALFGTLEDVTESERIADQLKHLEEQYQLLLSTMHTPKLVENREVINCLHHATPSFYVNEHLMVKSGKVSFNIKNAAGNMLPLVLPNSTKIQTGRKAVLVEKVKAIIIQLIRNSEEQLQINFSQYLSDQLHYDYKYLSSLFTEYHGDTIQHFFAAEKIEAVKQLLTAGELNLTEIAWKLHYSSVGHLSNQFKKLTGITPSQFKLLDK